MLHPDYLRYYIVYLLRERSKSNAKNVFDILISKQKIP